MDRKVERQRAHVDTNDSPQLLPKLLFSSCELKDTVPEKGALIFRVIEVSLYLS